jgi:hypothetical protein
MLKENEYKIIFIQVKLFNAEREWQFIKKGLLEY